ncbi:hypothetical protein [Rhodophyticola porphyridii]|uniref:Uncharacterized protein n=1 Tax=Rhodophyticola porphyridii TaxID=1852017 RepID=A0A3L9Y3H7_9RHOB|nr:hypothetical protein [Rhodophyticola porphyridii]RMA43289.1 hypothetical protein D9R08_06660 [Rhodophyticola porphyridii]
MDASLTKNPRIIIEVIRELIDSDFEGNVQRAAEEISRVALEDKRSKRDYKVISASILYAIMADKSHIKFSQVEMIATYIGIPVGVFLFLTRIRASRRDNNGADLQYLKSVYAVLGEVFEQNSAPVSYEKIKEIGSGNVQLSLWEEDSSDGP